MHTIKSIALFISLFPLLTSCALPGKIANQKLESSKNIAVVSLLGDTFHGIHIGGTVFHNEAYKASVPDWKIDALAEQIVTEHISKNSSRHAATLNHDAGLSDRFIKSFSYFNSGYNYDEVINLAKQQGADTLILIQATKYDNAPHHKPGYGFYDGTFFSSRHSCVYSLFTINVFSIATREKTGWEWGFPTCYGENYLPWKNSFDKYSEDEKTLMRKKTEENIKANVIKAISGIGF